MVLTEIGWAITIGALIVSGGGALGFWLTLDMQRKRRHRRQRHPGYYQKYNRINP